jgi:hypothetical protein
MKTKKIEPRFVTNREYKPDRAMLEAIRRSKDHPRPISMVSNVKDFAKMGGDK